VAVSKIDLDAEMDIDEPKKEKKKVLWKYRPSYEIKYSVIRKSRIGNNHAYCTACRCDFSVGHGGIGNMEKCNKVGSSAGQ